MVEPEINEKYKGNESIAITRYRNMYSYKIGFDDTDLNLTWQLDSEREAIPDPQSYEILMRYDHVDMLKVVSLIKHAVMEFEKDSKPNLVTLLAD